MNIEFQLPELGEHIESGDVVNVLVEEGDVMIDVITRVAHERGTTYILMGTPPARSGWQRLVRPSLLFQILRALPGVDLRIVADRTQRPDGDR